MSDSDVILRIYANKLKGLSPLQREMTPYLKGLKDWLQFNAIFRSPLKTIRSLEHPNFFQRKKLTSVIRDVLKDDRLCDIYSPQIIVALGFLIKSLSDDEINQMAGAILNS